MGILEAQIKIVEILMNLGVVSNEYCYSELYIALRGLMPGRACCKTDLIRVPTRLSVKQKEPVRCMTRVRWVLLAIVEHKIHHVFGVQTFGEITRFAHIDERYICIKVCTPILSIYD